MRRRRSSREEPRQAQTENVVRVPHDSVNEQVILAAVVVDEEIRERYLRTLSGDLFYGTQHSLIWRSLQELYRQGLSYDPMTLRSIAGPDLDPRYFDDLLIQRPIGPPNINFHVDRLYWDHARIATAKGPLTRLLEMVRDPKTEPDLLRAAAQAVADSLRSGTNRTLRNPRQLIEEHDAELTRRRTSESTWGFGLPGLDYFPEGETQLRGTEVLDVGGYPRLIPGTAPKMVTTVSAVSGGGKTTLITRGVLGMFGHGRRITYGAYEQGSGLTLELLATMSLGLSRTDMMSGRFSAEDQAEIKAEMERISERVVFDEIPFERFATREGNPNARAMDRVAQAIIDSRCDVYVADLFKRQLKDMRPEEEEERLWQVHHLAEQLGVHIILAQQQKLKEVEATKSKLPRRDTIKGNSAWVDISDQILLAHRPAYWKNIPDDKFVIIVAKQRHGKAPWMVEFDYDGEYGSIEGGKTIEVQREGDQDGADGMDGFWGPVDPK